MLKMAFYVFWHNGFNIWKMTPARPPSPPTYVGFPNLFKVTLSDISGLNFTSKLMNG